MPLTLYFIFGIREVAWISDMWTSLQSDLVHDDGVRVPDAPAGADHGGGVRHGAVRPPDLVSLGPASSSQQ